MDVLGIIILVIFLIVFDVAILISWRFHEAVFMSLFGRDSFSPNFVFKFIAISNLIMILVFILLNYVL